MDSRSKMLQIGFGAMLLALISRNKCFLRAISRETSSLVPLHFNLICISFRCFFIQISVSSDDGYYEWNEKNKKQEGEKKKGRWRDKRVVTRQTLLVLVSRSSWKSRDYKSFAKRRQILPSPWVKPFEEGLIR